MTAKVRLILMAVLVGLVAWPVQAGAENRPLGEQVVREDVARLARAIGDSLKPKQALVLSANDEDIYLSVGIQDGVQPETVFEIVRLGAELKTPTGEVLGREEKKLGEVQIASVRDRYSVAKPVGTLSTKAAPGDAAIQKADALNIAVTSFAPIGTVSDAFLEYVREVLTTELVAVGPFRLVERSKLDSVFAEGRLGASGLVDAKSAQELGRILGADAVVVGSIAQSATDYTVTARVILCRTGAVVMATSMQLPKVVLTGTGGKPQSVFDLISELTAQVDAQQKQILDLKRALDQERTKRDEQWEDLLVELKSVLLSLKRLVDTYSQP